MLYITKSANYGVKTYLVQGNVVQFSVNRSHNLY